MKITRISSADSTSVCATAERNYVPEESEGTHENRATGERGPRPRQFTVKPVARGNGGAAERGFRRSRSRSE